MKPEWITDEVVRLAKQLYDAGYRKEIQEGDWCLTGKASVTPLLWQWKDKTLPKLIPIPDLSTCLAWLRNEVVDPCVELSVDNMWVCRITIGTDFIANCDYTPLEACYLAMIKILEATDAETK